MAWRAASPRLGAHLLLSRHRRRGIASCIDREAPRRRLGGAGRPSASSPCGCGRWGRGDPKRGRKEGRGREGGWGRVRGGKEGESAGTPRREAAGDEAAGDLARGGRAHPRVSLLQRIFGGRQRISPKELAKH